MSRLMVAVVVGQLLAAVALWGAAALGGDPAAAGLRAVALLAVAGVAGTIASGGLLRRLIGGLLALAGVLAGVIGVGGPLLAVLLALLGAALLLAAGAVLAVRGPMLPRMGSRFDPTGGPAGKSRQDPDRRMWDALDAGDDPTAR
jgi:hypothetical protein